MNKRLLQGRKGAQLVCSLVGDCMEAFLQGVGNGFMRFGSGGLGLKFGGSGL